MKFLIMLWVFVVCSPIYAEETGAVLLENLPLDSEIFVKNDLKSQKGNDATIIILPVGLQQIELRKNGHPVQTLNVEIIKDKLIQQDITPPCEKILKQLSVTQNRLELDKEFVERRQQELNNYNQEIQKHTINYQAGTVDINTDNFDIRTNTLTLSINWSDCVSKHPFSNALISQKATLIISREQLKEMLQESSQKSVFIYFKLDDQPLLKQQIIIDRVVLVGLNQEWLIKPISGQLTITVPQEFEELVKNWRDTFTKNPSINAHINMVTTSLKEGVSQLTDEVVNFALFLRKDKEYPSFPIFQKKYAYEPNVIDIGKGAFVIYAHKDNPLYNLTVKDVDGIFSKNEKKNCGGNQDILYWNAFIKTKYNWELKGHSLGDKTIKLVGLPMTGSSDLLAQQLLLCGGNFKPALETKENSEQILSIVSKNVEMLGYANWFDQISSTKQDVEQIAIAGVRPTKQNVLTGKYSYGYFISFLARKPLSPLEIEFVKFVLSEEGQTIVENAGFIAFSLPKK